MNLRPNVSVLYREPKLLKVNDTIVTSRDIAVSVLYREPKLLKDRSAICLTNETRCFSALP